MGRPSAPLRPPAQAQAQSGALIVPCWKGDPKYSLYQQLQSDHPAASPAPSQQLPLVRKPTDITIRQSVHKVARQKGISTGRTYTSKFRGVHQTFPTRRWEAQFRRAGAAPAPPCALRPAPCALRPAPCGPEPVSQSGVRASRVGCGSRRRNRN